MSLQQLVIDDRIDTRLAAFVQAEGLRQALIRHQPVRRRCGGGCGFRLQRLAAVTLLALEPATTGANCV